MPIAEGRHERHVCRVDLPNVLPVAVSMAIQSHAVRRRWDGLAEVVVAQSRGLYDGQGRRVATLAMDENDDRKGEERLVLIGDFSGDGVPDVLLTSRSLTHVYVYKNEHGRKPQPPAPLGTERNFTLY
jgi:hypothetical protein